MTVLRRLTSFALLGAATLALAGCNDGSGDPQAQLGADPKLPAQQNYLLPPMHLAKIIGWQQGETPTVANGLQIKALATGLEHPRVVYTLPNGDILVVESKAPPGPAPRRPKDIVMGFVESWATGGGGNTGPGNRITLLRDADGDGVAEVRSVFLDHLYSPFGVALVGNDLYVANADAIVRYPYREGDTKITAPGTELTKLPGGPINHHWTKSLVASRDGKMLYVGVGSNSNIAENGMEAEKNRAAILEVDRESGRTRLFASGLRNPNGLSFEPQTGALWAVINERDEIGPDLVPDYLTSVKDGAFYGWPYSYWGQHVDPRVQPPRPDLVASAVMPDYSLSSHVAPLGLVFTGDAAGLPGAYRNGAFIGEHGSWNRQQLNGYKVVFVPFSNGKPSGPAQDVVTGFLKDGQARGRPVGVALDRRGALLVADDTGNAVWRVTAAPGQSASR
jgi:glucose/arabinose dehydrogenase